MAAYVTFDNEDVHLHTRQQVALMVDVIASALSCTVFLVLGALIGLLPVIITAGGLLLAWMCIAGWTLLRLRRLRRIAWCVRLSDHRVVSYDYTRRPTRTPWRHLQRVDLKNRALHLVGPNPKLIEVPHRFGNFSDVSHAIVDHAEENNIPVHVDGQRWDTLNVYTLYPGLDADPNSNS